MSAPENIVELVSRFEEQRSAYRSGRYNETQLRRLPQDKEMLTCQIAATDAAIDQLVYALYGLSETEIRLVEG